MRLFNFDCVESDREWLRKLVVSDTSDSEEEEPTLEPDGRPSQPDIQQLLKMHLRKKKWEARHHTNLEVCMQ